MRASVSLHGGKGGKAPRAALGATLGISFGLFISGYWLIDLLPAESGQLLLLTAAVALAACFLYFVLLGWMWSRIRELNSVSCSR